MKQLYIFIVVAFFSQGIPAQTGSRKGDRYYEARCYALAIPHYEKALKGDSGSTELQGKLGDCYRLTNNAEGALQAYGQLVNSGRATDLQRLYYADALTMAGRFNDAKPYYEQYSADARGISKASSASKVNDYSRNADAYRLSQSRFNSPSSDFGAMGRSGSVYFLSSRRRSRWIFYRHGWTNQVPLRMYKVAAVDSLAKLLKVKPSFKFNAGPFCFVSDSVVLLTRNESEATSARRDGIRKLKIYQATVKDNAISHIKLLSLCNGDFNYVHPAVSSDGSTLYFASDMDGGVGGMDIFVSTRDGSGNWSTPQNLGDRVNTAGNELFPFITAGGLLYFSSNGHDGLGGLDVYETRIRDGKAGRIYNMGLPVNSRDDDFAYYPDEDGRAAFLSSNRERGGMDDDIFRVDILREVKRGKDVIIQVKDKATLSPLAGVTVFTGADSVITDDRGEYSTMVDEDKTLRLRTYHPDYFSASDSVVALATSDDKITRTIMMEKDPKLALVSRVLDLKTAQPLDNVKVTIRELPDGKVLDSYLSTVELHRNALPEKRIGDKLGYEFTMEKEGYLTKKTTFIYDVKVPGDIDVNQSVDLSLGKVEVGMDVGKMIDLKPIYFDLGKSTIRKDAAMELDKIVAIMKEYPNMSIELGAHTDCRSAAASNMKLSTARAKASAGYIVKKGIDKSRITGKGYGESRLLNNCGCEGKVKSACSEEEHAKNRRTEFIITRLK